MAAHPLFPLDPTAHSLLLDQLLSPAERILQDYVRGVYREGPLDDRRFLRLGVQRTLSQCASGRDFLQQRQELFADPLARSSFFDSLHSSRRRQVLAEVNHQLVQRSRAGCLDLLGRFPELKDVAVYAVDGHHLEHAVHSPADAKGAYVSANNLYVLCLHTGLLCNLGAVQGDGVQGHEMPVLRERLAPWLAAVRGRRGQRPTIVVGDPAFVDKQYWTRMSLSQEKVWFITRTKANMKAIIYSHRAWDPDAQINAGVLADQTVGFDGSILMRRIRYRDPESGTEYEFVTSVKELAPGLIALLYLLRWRIEKVFDTGKNPLAETKCWAVGAVAQDIRAHCFALTHNLLVLLRRNLERTEGIREQKVIRKHRDDLHRRERRATEAGAQVAPVQWQLPPVVQLTAQFIRTLRNGIIAQITWVTAVALLRTTTKAYL